MTTMGDLYERLRNLWDGQARCFRAPEAVRGILAELVEAFLQGAYSLEDAVSLLEFWAPRSADFAGWFASVCDSQEHSLQDECQKIERQRQEAEKALTKRHLWIEKLVLIAGIQRLESDSRLQAYSQVEDLRREIQQAQQEIAELEKTLRTRLTHLRTML